jgi:hypothetical protein
MKLQKKIKIKLKEYTQNYYELKTKSENALKEMNPDNNSINNLNITDIQLNQKYANEHEELIHFYDKIINKIDLFTELIKNENFEKILNYFEIIFKDCNNDYFDNTDLKDLDKFDDVTLYNNIKNKNKNISLKKVKLNKNKSDIDLNAKNKNKIILPPILNNKKDKLYNKINKRVKDKYLMKNNNKNFVSLNNYSSMFLKYNKNLRNKSSINISNKEGNANLV